MSGLVAVALTGAVVAGLVGSSAAGAPRPAMGPVVRVDDTFEDALAAFRRPAQQGDLVPLGVRAALAGSQGVSDVNPDLARAVGPRGKLYLMPGDDQLCVGRDLARGSVVYCAAGATLAQGAFVGAVVHTADGLEVSGIVGDGSSAARIATVDGTIDVDVVDGAVVAASDAPPVSISWVDRDGERHAQAIGAPR